MAPLNPDVPKVAEPSFLGLSQPISQPEGNKTAASLIKGFGDTLSAALQGVDESFKAVIRDKIYKEYDPMVQDNIQPVEDYMASGKAAGAESLATAEASIPEGLEDGLGNLAAAQAGYESTASRTLKAQYRKDIYTIAKDLRGQFAGYREYIDQKIGEVVSRDPANKNYEQTLSLLNKQVADANKEKSMALREAQLGRTFRDNMQ